MNKYFQFTCYTACLLFSTLLNAQTPLEEYKVKYPDEAVVYLDHSSELFIEIENDALEINSVLHDRKLYLNNLATSNSKEDISYSGFYEVSDINAYTEVPNGNRYKKVKVTEFKEKDELSGDIFHDDIKSINFYFPKLQEGAITNLHYNEKIKEPRFINSFFFGNFVPIEKAAYKIVCDEDVELEIKYFHTDASKLNYSKTSKRGKNIHSWELKDIEAWESEAGGPPIRSYLPHIMVYIKNYKVNDKEHTVLSEVKDLHHWYRNFLKDLNKDNNPQLQSVVDSLTATSTTELEKVKNIYYWVQDHIKYIAKEDGLGGFIPADASNVYESRYGDCKGMSSIMNEMLGMAGVKSHLTWVGTRDIPYRYEEVPTPVVDNHMIVTYEADDQLYFLDATGSFSPMGLPSSFIQGKEALVDLGGENFKVVEVPEVASHYNVNVDTARIHLEDKKLLGKGNASYSGFYKVRVSERMHYQTDKERKKYLNNLFEKGNNKFLVKDYKIDALKDRDEELRISYDFSIDDYAFQNEDEWYVNMNLDKYLKEQEIKKDRKRSVKNRFEYEQKNTIILDIPESYEVNYVPENSEYKHELFGYNISYQEKEGKVFLDVNIYERYLELQPEHFEAWNEMIKSLKKNYKEVLILKKK